MNDKEAAKEALNNAIDSLINLEGGFKEGEYLGDWALIAYLPNVEKTNTSSYFSIFSLEDCPNHIGVGLFTEAVRHCNSQEEEPEDD